MREIGEIGQALLNFPSMVRKDGGWLQQIQRANPSWNHFPWRRANLRKRLSCRETGGRYHESLCSLCSWIPWCPGGPYDKQDLSCDRYCVRLPVSPARVGTKHRSLKFCLGSLSLRQSIQQIKLSVPTWHLSGDWQSSLWSPLCSFGCWRWPFLCCIVPKGAFGGWGGWSEWRWLLPNSTAKPALEFLITLHVGAPPSSRHRWAGLWRGQEFLGSLWWGEKGNVEATPSGLSHWS